MIEELDHVETGAGSGAGADARPRVRRSIGSGVPWGACMWRSCPLCLDSVPNGDRQIRAADAFDRADTGRGGHIDLVR